MGTIFTLSDDIIEVSQTLLDDMINELGKIIRLVYEPVKSECPNCLWSPITNRSSGIYQTGGSSPFSEGETCPVCEGAGWIVSETKFDDVMAGVSRTPKEWYIPIPPTVVLPNDAVQLKFFKSDWQKVKRARYIILAPEQNGVDIETYKLHSNLGDPSNLVPGRYSVGLFIRT